MPNVLPLFSRHSLATFSILKTSLSNCIVIIYHACMPQALQTISADLKQFLLFHVCCTFPVLHIINIDLILLKQARFLPLS